MIRWLLSKTHREASALHKHVRRLLNAQRDLMSTAANQMVLRGLDDLRRAIDDRVNHKEMRKQIERTGQVAEKWIQPYPHPVWRENVEVLLVALAVAMGIRTFFLQPFKIPTGSMQPTLYGVTSKNLIGDKNSKIPTGMERAKEWFQGISYIHFVAPVSGAVEDVSKPWPGVVFSVYQRVKFAGEWHTIWFPPDLGEAPLEYRAGLTPKRVYQQGEDVWKLEVQAGDHLFVDRLTYNFRKPRRGEIVVFQTSGIPEEKREIFRIPPDIFYIKRLVGLGGETLSLKQDYDVTDVVTFGGATVPVGHLVVNGQPLSASTPHFESLYAFSEAPAGAKTLKYEDFQYFGHAMVMRLSPNQQFHVQPDHYFVMGDNTFNSSDSRYWGDFPASDVIGKSFFVYWPLTKRFGIGQSVTAQ